VPENGYFVESSYGTGWKCHRRYQAIKDKCIAVKVPANGYLAGESSGSGWKCDRGYVAVKGACQAVKIPQNAHLDYSGDNWECNKPFQKQNDRCAQP